MAAKLSHLLQQMKKYLRHRSVDELQPLIEAKGNGWEFRRKLYDGGNDCVSFDFRTKTIAEGLCVVNMFNGRFHGWVRRKADLSIEEQYDGAETKHEGEEWFLMLLDLVYTTELRVVDAELRLTPKSGGKTLHEVLFGDTVISRRVTTSRQFTGALVLGGRWPKVNSDGSPHEKKGQPRYDNAQYFGKATGLRTGLRDAKKNWATDVNLRKTGAEGWVGTYYYDTIYVARIPAAE